jgi:predicted kinase
MPSNSQLNRTGFRPPLSCCTFGGRNVDSLRGLRMTRLFGMCGLSFSGKTTLARAIARIAHAEYVGLDDINEERGLRGGEGVSAEEWEKTSLIAAQRTGTLLDAGCDVVLDDTLCYQWLRARYAALADRHRAKFVLIYVCTPLLEIRRAMLLNDADHQRSPIRAEVFAVHARSFECPTADEHPLVYDRIAPVDDWIGTHLLRKV